MMAATRGPAFSLPTWIQFLRPIAIGRIEFLVNTVHAEEDERQDVKSESRNSDPRGTRGIISRAISDFSGCFEATDKQPRRAGLSTATLKMGILFGDSGSKHL
jgi:hypothetical protein